MLRALAFVLFGLVCIPASGQIVYEPVQYQYCYNGQTFYYGGTNPHILAYAYRQAAMDAIQSYGTFGHRFAKHAPVYSDLLPYRDMTDYGFTAADAANDANASAPLYYRKIDLLKAAVPAGDGTWIVPAKVAPQGSGAPITSRYSRVLPAARKGEIIIIPKNLLDRPLKSFAPRDRHVASAN